MLHEIKNWTDEQNKLMYAHYRCCNSEHDSDFYQGQLAMTTKMLAFIEALEDRYKDDLK